MATKYIYKNFCKSLNFVRQDGKGGRGSQKTRFDGGKKTKGRQPFNFGWN